MVFSDRWCVARRETLLLPAVALRKSIKPTVKPQRRWRDFFPENFQWILLVFAFARWLLLSRFCLSFANTRIPTVFWWFLCFDFLSFDKELSECRCGISKFWCRRIRWGIKNFSLSGCRVVILKFSVSRGRFRFWNFWCPEVGLEF